jgi:alpha-glucosidase
MDLTGRPPVPPKKMLGAWISGLKEIQKRQVSAEELLDTAEPPAAAAPPDKTAAAAALKEKLARLRETVPNFSGLTAGLDADLPALLAATRADDLGLILDESARIPQQSPNYPEMARRSFLVKKGGPQGQPLAVNYFGRSSGLVDYTSAAAAAFWHSLDRKTLTDEGQTYFRLLDGDLEDTGPEAWYAGRSESGPHSHYVWANAYALKWLEGLESRLGGWGFRPLPRPMLMTRTGAAGLARYSGYLYNGDTFIFTGGFSGQSIFGIRAHLALAGVDYYSNDLTSSLENWPVERFFQSYDAWLAKSALTEYPLILPEELAARPAGQNNLALRESLSPYIYSLAWRAWLEGRPVLAPLVYYFQEDLKARDRLPEIMLGPDLLVSRNLDGNAERTKVYVPRGRWYDWHTGEVIDQDEGGELDLDTKVNGQFTPPILARGGAIIPAVEYLHPKDGVSEKMAALKIFIGREPSEIIWYEDDGYSQLYRQGEQRFFGRTGISAVTRDDGSTLVTIKAREGGWSEAPDEKALLIDIYGPQAPGQATLDNLPHNRVAQAAALDRMESGWASFGNNRIRFKTPPLKLSVDHVLWFK